ncbi:MAG: hypothetical protein R3E76_03935 [Planctomycetota bacterium]
MDTIPAFVKRRIHQAPPDGVRVVPGSTPVISFGDFRTARVATLGWNPSKNEFLDRSGRELDAEARRLHTHTSLGRSLLSDRRSTPARLVLEGCNGYFQRNPYHWFNKLEHVLNRIGASYWDGSSCHLDLVQWATDPVWRDLSDIEKSTLLDSDIPFLRQQLRKSRIKILLLNGRGIVNAVQGRLGIRLETVGKKRGHRAEFFVGQATDRLKVVGWSINLQSSRGVSHGDIKSVANRVTSILT